MLVKSNKLNSIFRFCNFNFGKGFNIANLSNKSRGDYAVTLLDVDEEVSANSIKSIENVDGIIKVREIK